MNSRQKSEKFEALARYIENYDYNNLSTLMFPKEDSRFLLEACDKQVAEHVRLNEGMGILYCPHCERACRKGYDLFCSGCGKKLKYDE